MLSRLIPKPSHLRRFLSIPLKPSHTAVNPFFTVVVPKHFSTNRGGGNDGDGKDPFSSRVWKDFRETEEKLDAFFEEEECGSLAGMNDDGSSGGRRREERGWLQEEEQGWLQEKGLDDADEDAIFKGIDEESGDAGGGGFDESNFGVRAGEDFKPWSMKGEEDDKKDVFDFKEDVGHEGNFTALDINPKVDVEQLEKEEQALTAVVRRDSLRISAAMALSLLIHCSPTVNPLRRSPKPTLRRVNHRVCVASAATPLLQVNDLRAKIVESNVDILHGVNLTVNQGEVHAIMGKNGSGKSTFAKVLVGHPDYEVTGGSVVFKGENLLEMEPEERSLAGLFMSFQSPVEIPGVSNDLFLAMAYNARMKKLGREEVGPIEFLPYLMEKLQLVNMKADFLNRNVNQGFSGGERKRNEILQLAVLGADLAILDEIDSGLDVDALRDVANAVNRILTPEKSLLMITHYRRILDLLNPTHVHVMDKGKIARSGDISMVEAIEADGYETVSALT